MVGTVIVDREALESIGIDRDITNKEIKILDTEYWDGYIQVEYEFVYDFLPERIFKEKYDIPKSWIKIKES